MCFAIDRQVSVTGECRKKLSPDKITITYQVNKTGKKPKFSSNVAAKTYNSLIKKVKSLNLTNRELETGSYNTQPEYSWEKGKRRLKGYRTRISLSVKTSSIDKASDLLILGSEIGVEETNGPNPYVSRAKRDKFHDSCLTTASKRALEKAQILAKSLKASVGEVVTITEHYSNNHSYDGGVRRMSKSSFQADKMESVSIQMKKQDYSLKVNATFSLK